MNLLFTCAGRRNYLLKYFKEIIGKQGVIIAVDSNPLAPAFADADLSFEMQPVHHPEYLVELKDVIDRYQVDLVIPLNDIELPLLSKNKSYLESGGARVVVSNEKIVSIASDKWKTFRFFQHLNIKTPLSFLSVNDAEDAISNGLVNFPLILKPRWGSASIGIKQVDNRRELRLAYEWLNVEIEKSVLNQMNFSQIDEAIIIQEKLTGQEFGMDILNDFEGRHYGSFARKKLIMRSGETDKATTAISEQFSELGRKLSGQTKHIGIMDCDFFLANDQVYFLEMNPRFGGGYPLSHAGGVNVPGIYIEWSKGNRNVSEYDNYIDNLTFSKCDTVVNVPKQNRLNVESILSL
ncbi:ATP-grasp domain-containing protein [Pricia sp. S334]|uniref:ATP-grasp domain-containing protein n=1 Tax=Pricia mediterranea TaxID=3076079 RepID=A0ABU3L6G6_9FLAO|nr:ATP-grasp domain-containing protein [Pricia sp. S334]MDT7829341.1 ATP-grasp domain-containing protein [Pricia sp. S334]